MYLLLYSNQSFPVSTRGLGRKIQVFECLIKALEKVENDDQFSFPTLIASDLFAEIANQYKIVGGMHFLWWHYASIEPIIGAEDIYTYLF